MKIKAWMMVVVSGAVLALAGCMSYSDGPYVGVAQPNNPEASGKPVVLLHHDLVSKLAVDHAPVVTRNANNLMQIQVGLRNRSDDERLRLQVQTLFFDQAGLVLYSEPGSETAWQTLVFSPNETVYYTQQALTPEAVRFVVRVRYLRRTR